jgi:hypothetical protein
MIRPFAAKRQQGGSAPARRSSTRPASRYDAPMLARLLLACSLAPTIAAAPVPSPTTAAPPPAHVAPRAPASPVAAQPGQATPPTDASPAPTAPDVAPVPVPPAPAPTSPPRVIARPAPPPPPGVPPPSPEPPRPPGKGLVLAGALTLSVGGLLLLSGAVAYATTDALNEPEDLESKRDLTAISLGLAIAGVAHLAAGLPLVIVGRARQRRAAAPRVTLRPQLGPRHWGAGLAVRF